MTRGLAVTGLGNLGQGGAAWGVYIAFDIYFVGASFAGISIAALTRLFDIKHLKPISRMAELVAILSLLMGTLCVLADLGRPLEGLLSLPRYARTQSPFFGTFSLVVATYLFASFVYLFLDGREDAARCALLGGRLARFHTWWACGYRGTPSERRRRSRASFWLAVLILPLLVAAHSTLGLIFGLQGGRPGWFSSLQGPSFVVMAGVSGIGLIVVVAGLARRLLRLETRIPRSTFRWLGNSLFVLCAVYLYLMVIEGLTATYAAPQAEARVARQVMVGQYAPIFWSVVGGLACAAALMFVQFLRGGSSIGWTMLAGLLANAASILKRYLIVVTGQTHGLQPQLPSGRYVPSWVEVCIVTGLLALGASLFLVFVKLFPILPLVPDVEAPPEGEGADIRRGWDLRRVLFCAAPLGLGLALAIVGFLGSARVGTQSHLDPVIPFSPVIFILGLILCFATALVYEILPDRN